MGGRCCLHTMHQVFTSGSLEINDISEDERTYPLPDQRILSCEDAYECGHGRGSFTTARGVVRGYWLDAVAMNATVYVNMFYDRPGEQLPAVLIQFPILFNRLPRPARLAECQTFLSGH